VVARPLEHARPLGVVVRGDVARRADAGVVDQHVDAAELLGRLRHRSVDRGPVGDVGRKLEQPAGAVVLAVDDRHGGAARPQEPGRGGTDAARAARHDRRESLEVGHDDVLAVGSMWTLGPGPAPAGRPPLSTASTSSRVRVAATRPRGSTAPDA